MVKKALITGITGQDGSYLAELLLENGYDVYGVVRQITIEDPTNRLKRIRHICDHVHLLPGSIDSYPSLYNIFSRVQPDEVYHLAAQSYVSYSFEDEYSIINTNINGTHHVLSTFKEIVPNARFYYAGSSEMFGKAATSPQDESTPFNPRSSYGISKVAGFHLTRNYRDAYNLYSCSGILYNHESPRRGFEFVTRKITSHAAMIKYGLKDKLELGNIDAERDWGHSRDYVRAMSLMLQQNTPGDYVISTGAPHSVREFCRTAFAVAGLNYEDYVVENEKFYRPAEKVPLVGNPSKAKNELGWQAEVAFEAIVAEMVENDLRHFRDHDSGRAM